MPSQGRWRLEAWRKRRPKLCIIQGSPGACRMAVRRTARGGIQPEFRYLPLPHYPLPKAKAPFTASESSLSSPRPNDRPSNHHFLVCWIEPMPFNSFFAFQSMLLKNDLTHLIRTKRLSRCGAASSQSSGARRASHSSLDGARPCHVDSHRSRIPCPCTTFL